MIKKIKNDKNFITYCETQGIDIDKLFGYPKSYSDEVIYFQVINREKGKLGLYDSVPAKVILKVEYDDGNLICTPSEDILDYVGRS